MILHTVTLWHFRKKNVNSNWPTLETAPSSNFQSKLNSDQTARWQPTSPFDCLKKLNFTPAKSIQNPNDKHILQRFYIFRKNYVQSKLTNTRKSTVTQISIRTHLRVAIAACNSKELHES
jgi:hypothetical protein